MDASCSFWPFFLFLLILKAVSVGLLGLQIACLEVHLGKQHFQVKHGGCTKFCLFLFFVLSFYLFVFFLCKQFSKHSDFCK